MREEMDRLLPPPPGRNLSADRHQVIRDFLTDEARRTGAATWRPDGARPGRTFSGAVASAFRPKAPGSVRPRMSRTALVAATAAAVVAGTVLALPGTSGTGGTGTGTGPHRIAAMTVAQVLDAAARNSAKQPDKKLGPHQWFYMDRILCMPSGCVHTPAWNSYSGSASEAAQARETLKALNELPTDPHELLDRIVADPAFKRFSASGPVHEDISTVRLSRILGVLQNVPGIPHRIEAALFHALALIPDVHLVGHPMRDAAGRPVLAIEYNLASPPARRYLFLDATTFAYRGWRTEWLKQKGRFWSFAILGTSVVDHEGQTPGGPAPDHSGLPRTSSGAR
ncbi:hypothetical protein [Streptomyces sp. HPF1205]|uniref:hypothetical protein n=1 Tax=Streptomyces sp. HPF1205 TaxID=2873262 RepID=UPI001CED8925|nr:hypothetical protein [Streptomyces sp. HPF1205]